MKCIYRGKIYNVIQSNYKGIATIVKNDGQVKFVKTKNVKIIY